MAIKKKYKTYILISQFAIVGAFAIWYAMYSIKYSDADNTGLFIGGAVAICLIILITYLIAKIGKRDLS